MAHRGHRHRLAIDGLEGPSYRFRNDRPTAVYITNDQIITSNAIRQARGIFDFLNYVVAKLLAVENHT